MLGYRARAKFNDGCVSVRQVGIGSWRYDFSYRQRMMNVAENIARAWRTDVDIIPPTGDCGAVACLHIPLKNGDIVRSFCSEVEDA